MPSPRKQRKGWDACGCDSQAGFWLLLQLGGEVGDDRYGLIDLLRNAVEEDFLTIGGDVIEHLGSRPVADQPLWSAKLQCAADLLDRHRVQIVGRIHVVELLAVTAPLGQPATVGRELPLALPAAKGQNIHLNHTGSSGGVGEPVSVGRTLCTEKNC